MQNYTVKQIYGNEGEFDIYKLCFLYANLKDTRNYFQKLIEAKHYEGEFEKAEFVILLATIKQEMDRIEEIAIQKDRQTFNEFFVSLEDNFTEY